MKYIFLNFLFLFNFNVFLSGKKVDSSKDYQNEKNSDIIPLDKTIKKKYNKNEDIKKKNIKYVEKNFNYFFPNINENDKKLKEFLENHGDIFEYKDGFLKIKEDQNKINLNIYKDENFMERMFSFIYFKNFKELDKKTLKEIYSLNKNQFNNIEMNSIVFENSKKTEEIEDKNELIKKLNAENIIKEQEIQYQNKLIEKLNIENIIKEQEIQYQNKLIEKLNIENNNFSKMFEDLKSTKLYEKLLKMFNFKQEFIEKYNKNEDINELLEEYNLNLKKLISEEDLSILKNNNFVKENPNLILNINNSNNEKFDFFACD